MLLIKVAPVKLGEISLSSSNTLNPAEANGVPFFSLDGIKAPFSYTTGAGFRTSPALALGAFCPVGTFPFRSIGSTAPAVLPAGSLTTSLLVPVVVVSGLVASSTPWNSGRPKNASTFSRAFVLVVFSAYASSTRLTSAASAGLLMSLPCINLFLINVAVRPMPRPLNVLSSMVVGSCCGVSCVGFWTTVGSGATAVVWSTGAAACCSTGCAGSVCCGAACSCTGAVGAVCCGATVGAVGATCCCVGSTGLGPRLAAKFSFSAFCCAIVCAKGDGCLANDNKSILVGAISAIAALSFAAASLVAAAWRCCSRRSRLAAALSALATVISACLVGAPCSSNKLPCTPLGSLGSTTLGGFAN